MLPVRLVASQTNDSILEDRSTQLLCVKYKNQYSGLYCKTGTTKVQGGKTVNHKNEDTPLDVVSSVDFYTSQLSCVFPIKEWVWNKTKSIWENVDITKEVAFDLSFAADGSCQILQDGQVVGTGSFAPRGIQDFSDVKRMADCLKLKFTSTIVTNPGDAEHEKTWTIDCDFVMSMMSRNNKLESWK